MSKHNSVKQAGRQTQQKIAEADVITTTQGGKDVAKAAARSGALVGFNSHTSRPPDEIPVNFVDWPYKQEEDDAEVSFVQHLLVVEREKPKYAVAPDVTEDRDFEQVVELADELDKHAETVIMVPKAVEPDRIPERFRVGVPFRDGFEGLPWPVWQFQNCEPLHILGGNPNKQVELASMLPRVASIDTANPTMNANWGKIWFGPADGYIQEKQGYYRSIEASMTSLIDHWSNNPLDARLRRNVAAEFFDLPEPSFGEDEDEDDETLPLLDYVGDPGCWFPDEEVPFPGRAYFYEVDDPIYEQGMTFGELQAKT